MEPFGKLDGFSPRKNGRVALAVTVSRFNGIRYPGFGARFDFQAVRDNLKPFAGRRLFQVRQLHGLAARENADKPLFLQFLQTFLQIFFRAPLQFHIEKNQGLLAGVFFDQISATASGLSGATCLPHRAQKVWPTRAKKTRK